MQTSIRADKTDQCRCNRTAGGTGLLSRGRLAEGERQSDVGAMKPTELKLEIEISRTNRYIYIYIYICIYNDVFTVVSSNSFKKKNTKNKKQNDAFLLGLKKKKTKLN